MVLKACGKGIACSVDVRELNNCHALGCLAKNFCCCCCCCCVVDVEKGCWPLEEKQDRPFEVVTFNEDCCWAIGSIVVGWKQPNKTQPTITHLWTLLLLERGKRMSNWLVIPSHIHYRRTLKGGCHHDATISYYPCYRRDHLCRHVDRCLSRCFDDDFSTSI